MSQISQENNCVETPPRYFPVKFVTFLRTPILKNICERLLLVEHKTLKFNSLKFTSLINFIKKTLQNKCFPVKFAKFLRTPFLKITSGAGFCSIYVFELCNSNTIFSKVKQSWLWSVAFF